jgi:hypothetical protein
MSSVTQIVAHIYNMVLVCYYYYYHHHYHYLSHWPVFNRAVIPPHAFNNKGKRAYVYYRLLYCVSPKNLLCFKYVWSYSVGWCPLPDTGRLPDTSEAVSFAPNSIQVGEGGGRFYASVRLQGGHRVHPGRAPLNHLHIRDRTGVRGFILPDGPQSHRGELSFPRCRHSPTYASAYTLLGCCYYYYCCCCCITSARVFWVGTMRA